MENVDQLDPLLQSLQALKPPGASKTKIAAITNLSVENVQSESVIAQRLYRHFKRTPGTHKLGVLYVVDSVTRQWIEKARQSGQELSGSAALDGTFASGVHKITELLPALIDDLIQHAPADHKAKVENLIQIWERGNTFPIKLLTDLKKRLAEPALAPFVKSSTPPGSPPSNLIASLGLNGQSRSDPAAKVPVAMSASAPAQPDASSILAALAGLQPMPAATPSIPVQAPPTQMAAAPPVPQAAASAPSAPTPDLASLLAGIGQPHQAPPPQVPQQQQMYGQPYQAPTPINPPAAIPPPQSYQPYYQPPTPVQQAPVQSPAAPNPLGALASLLPPHVLNNPAILTQVLNLLQGLQQEGITQEQWGAVILALYPPPQGSNVQASTPSWGAPAQDAYQQRPDTYSSYRERSPDRAGRRRSRSPDFRAQKSVGRRGSPVYGTYDASVANVDDNSQSSQFSDKRGRGRGGRNFRQRSPIPARNDHQESPIAPYQANAPKWTDIDPTLPAGHIKVLSRTLFVGGATGSEADLRAIFSRFGNVQTCIANEDKRHAFVKMCTRADAVSAKTGMENMRDSDVLSKARQTKWGVGFGPRECCDYATGISVIPIDTLTDADHKWMLTADFGGTGGRPIESGLVVEEPDIEIGAGVSSKAMSRRVGPDGGGNRRNRGGGGGGGGGRFRQPDSARQSPRPDPVTIPPPPPVPGFGFNFAMPGMPPYQ